MFTKSRTHIMNCLLLHKNMSPFAVTPDEYEAHKVRSLRSIHVQPQSHVFDVLFMLLSNVIFSSGEWVSVMLNHIYFFVPQGSLEGDLAKRAAHFFSENARVLAGWFLNIIVMHMLCNVCIAVVRLAHYLMECLSWEQELEPGLVGIYLNLVA
jgi:hypothetical protein